MSAAKPEVSIGMGLAVAVMVWGIYQHAMPSLIDHRASEAGDELADGAERTAGITAAVAVSAISLIAKDPTIFVIGGSAVVIASLWHKHANMVNPLTGRAFARNPMGPDDIAPDELVFAGGGDADNQIV